MTPDLQGFFYDPDEEGVDLALPQPEQPPLPNPRAGEEIEELLAFRVAGEDYAVEIAAVHEIVRPPPLAEVPRAPKAVLGVISLRGEALPVFDPVALLALEAPGETVAPAARRVIVLETQEGLAGLQVDSVEQVVRLPKGSIEPPPAGLSGKAAASLKGIGRWSGRLLAIVDPLELLGHEPSR